MRISRSNFSAITLLILFFLMSMQSFAQIKVTKVEPPNWWTQMKTNKIQLMIYGNDLKDAKAEFNTDKIKVTEIHNAENPGYLFVDIEISEDIEPKNYELKISKGKKNSKIQFPVLAREPNENRHNGFSTNDVVYLITPDRFVNGDEKNDNLKMNDKVSSDSPWGRHGGDIAGMISKLDYLKDLGVTAIWPNPLVENNTGVSYHGYAVTDMYKIDPRFGTNELYKEFVEKAHERGIKIILDHVANHIGVFHPWVENLPFNDWLNGTIKDPHITPHHNRTFFDPNSDQEIRDLTQNGWFVSEMPDLNQKNPFVANYLIQNTIWWIEYSGLDGIREDTYIYPDLEFLANWAEAILNEYPKFNIVGEVWIGETAFVAPYQNDSKLNKTDTNLPALLDFPLRDALVDVFANDADIFKIYETLAKDFLYTDPQNLMTFVDNHDVERIMFLAKEDLSKFKLALQFLFTTRGIPQIYYGTEIGMVGGPDHGSIREDFPGGFEKSTRNAFEISGRSEKENENFEFTKKLIKIRKENSALTEGKLLHYPPREQVYCYLRISGDQKILTIINNSNENKTADISLAEKHFENAKSFLNLMNNEEIKVENKIDVGAKSALILQIN